MACDAQSLINTAVANGYLALSDRDLKMALLASACGGGGGGSGGAGIVGNGSPEGVVTAPPGTTYLDSSGDHFWYKRTGVGNTGWIELIA